MPEDILAALLLVQNPSLRSLIVFLNCSALLPVLKLYEHLTDGTTEGMNLSNIIHNEHLGSHPHHRQSFPQSNQHRTLLRHPSYTYEGNMATVLTQNSYTSQPHLFTHAHHATHFPPSPPISEDSAKRLPSIQSLIEMSDPGDASPERK